MLDGAALIQNYNFELETTAYKKPWVFLYGITSNKYYFIFIKK
jgi:hypothetical protein